MSSARAKACPTGRELSLLASGARSERVRAHVGRCPVCAETLRSFQRIGDLARDLPTAPLTSEASRRVRSAVLAHVGETKSPRRWPWVVPLPIAAAAAAVWLLASAGSPPAELANRALPKPASRAAGAPAAPSMRPVEDRPLHPRRGRVHAHGGAHFVAERQQPDEIVRLEVGLLTIDVDPLLPGERFRVVTSDAEVEVHGTSFEVEARDQRLEAVRVLHGKVAVRVMGRRAVLLSAGDSWSADRGEDELHGPSPNVPARSSIASRPLRPRASGGPPAPAPAAAPASPIVEPPPPEERPSSPSGDRSAASQAEAAQPVPALVAGERELRDAWAALLASDHARAADEFARAEQAAGPGELAEDASFWRGVALARAGRSLEARRALAAFIERYAASPRRGEASAMLGWLLVDAGDLVGARSRFQAASTDRAPAVRESARRGLERLR